MSQPASLSSAPPRRTRVRPRRLWAFRLAALALSFALAFVLAELVLRVILTRIYRTALDSIPASVANDPEARLSAAQVFYPNPNPHLIYTLRPGVRGLFNGIPIQVSSAGLRDDEFTPAKPANTFRVLALGDSTLFGWGVEQTETYAELLEDSLRAEARRLAHPLQVEVINAGVPGYNSTQEIELFKTLSPELDPDAVVIQFDRNDIELPYGTIKPDFLRSRRLLFPLWREMKDGSLFDVRAFYILDQFHRFYAETPQSGWAGIQSAYRELHARCREHGIPLYVLLISEIQPRLFDDGPSDPTQEHMLRFCEAEGIPTIESRHIGAAILRRMNRSAWTDSVVSLYDPHPNALGHAIIAQAVYPTLHAALLSRAGEPPRPASDASGNFILRQLSQAGVYPPQRIEGERISWLWRRAFFDFIPQTSHLRVGLTVGRLDMTPDQPLLIFARVQGLSTPQAPRPEILRQLVIREPHPGPYTLDFDLTGLKGLPLHFSIESNLAGIPPEAYVPRRILLSQFEFLPDP